MLQPNPVFSDEQLNELTGPLDSRVVKERDGLAYIEGWHAINEANRIFGFGNWSGTVVSLECIGEESKDITSGRNAGKTQSRVGYRCVYQVAVNGVNGMGSTFSDVGFGNAISYGSLLDTHENAMKEAVTDAMKRCLRNFGNKFGNALYDKEQRNVDKNAGEREEMLRQAEEVEAGSKNVTLDMVNSAFKLVPTVKQEKAKNTIIDIVRKHGAEKLSSANEVALKEIYIALQEMAA